MNAPLALASVLLAACASEPAATRRPTPPSVGRSSVVLTSDATSELRPALCWDARRASFASDEACRDLVPASAIVRSTVDPTWQLTLGPAREVECRDLDGLHAGWRAHGHPAALEDETHTTAFGYGVYPAELPWRAVLWTHLAHARATQVTAAEQARLRAAFDGAAYFQAFGDELDLDADGARERLVLEHEPPRAVIVAWAGDLGRAERIPDFVPMGAIDMNGDGSMELFGSVSGQSLAIAARTTGRWTIVAQSRGCYRRAS